MTRRYDGRQQTLIVGIEAAYQGSELHHALHEEITLAHERGDVIATFRGDSVVSQVVIDLCCMMSCHTNVQEPEKNASATRQRNCVAESDNVVVVVPRGDFVIHPIMNLCQEIDKRYKLRPVKGYRKGAPV